MMSKEQIKQWIKEKNIKSVDDVQSALKDLFADTIQEMLEAEIESSLGYAKHDMKNKRTTNSRNGYSKKTVRSEYGDVDIQVPRDREGDFEPNIVKKHQSQRDRDRRSNSCPLCQRRIHTRYPRPSAACLSIFLCKLN